MNPIETAPKDGRLIIVGNKENNVSLVAYWDKNNRFWRGQGCSMIQSIDVKWDEKSPVQPDYWSELK